MWSSNERLNHWDAELANLAAQVRKGKTLILFGEEAHQGNWKPRGTCLTEIKDDGFVRQIRWLWTKDEWIRRKDNDAILRKYDTKNQANVII